MPTGLVLNANLGDRDDGRGSWPKDMPMASKRWRKKRDTPVPITCVSGTNEALRWRCLSGKYARIASRGDASTLNIRIRGPNGWR